MSKKEQTEKKTSGALEPKISPSRKQREEELLVRADKLMYEKNTSSKKKLKLFSKEEVK